MGRTLALILIVIALIGATGAYVSRDNTPDRCLAQGEVQVHANPDETSPVVDQVSSVELPVTASAPGWYKVTTAKLVEGWVSKAACSK